MRYITRLGNMEKWWKCPWKKKNISTPKRTLKNFQPLILRDHGRGHIEPGMNLLTKIRGPCNMKRKSIGMRIPQVGLRLIGNSRLEGGNGIVVCCLGVVGGMVLTKTDEQLTKTTNGMSDSPISSFNWFAIQIGSVPPKFLVVKKEIPKIFKKPRDLGL